MANARDEKRAKEEVTDSRIWEKDQTTSAFLLSYTAISLFSASIFCDEGQKVISVRRISMYANSRVPKARVVRGSNYVLKY